MNKEEFVNQMMALGIKLGNAKETVKQVEILDTAENLCDEYFGVVTKVNGAKTRDDKCTLHGVSNCKTMKTFEVTLIPEKGNFKKQNIYAKDLDEACVISERIRCGYKNSFVTKELK